ncbi:MAG: hypothetical protein IPK04_13155 [Bdellovibrionales bacterium]|nr:hypothetical protein [Bdellovibrionales bacterium]
MQSALEQRSGRKLIWKAILATAKPSEFRLRVSLNLIGGRIPDENHRLAALSCPFRDTQGHQFQ